MIDGKMDSFPLYETKTGWHRNSIDARKSDIEQLGEGTNLYFKFLKYIMFCLLLCSILSIPSLMINGLGFSYDSEERPYVKLLAKTTLGSIGNYQNMACSSASLPDTMNFASYIEFSCPKGMSMTSINQLGLAFQNETCTGTGFNKKVETIDRCTQKGDDFDPNIL